MHHGYRQGRLHINYWAMEESFPKKAKNKKKEKRVKLVGEASMEGTKSNTYSLQWLQCMT